MTENNAGQSRLFFDWSRIPQPSENAAELDRSTKEIFIRADAANTARLDEFSDVSDLYVFGRVQEKLLRLISELKSIRFLYLEDLSASDLAPLRELKSLEYLRVDRNTKIENLDDLSGLTGLKGMTPLQTINDTLSLVRPLLKVSRKSIDAYCDRHNLSPRLDASNKDLSYTRNRLRYQVLPYLERLNPGLNRRLCQNLELRPMTLVEKYLSVGL